MKKKILFINGHLKTGGVEKSLVDILRHINLEKYEVEVLLLEEYGDYYEEISSEIRVRLVDLHNTYGSLMQSIKKCFYKKDWKSLWIRIVFDLTRIFGKKQLRWLTKTIVGKQEYDYVIGFRTGIVSELVAYASNSKHKITWWHHGEYNLNDQQTKNFVETNKYMDKVVAVSRGCEKFLVKKFPELKEKICVIPNMLDIEMILEKSNSYIPFQKKEYVSDFVTIGRLSPEKHLENAILVAEYLKNKDYMFRWFLVGEGNQRKELENLILEKNLSDCVYLVGSKSNPYPYFLHSDYVVHTSYVESQCLVVLEAMTLGKVCIVTESIGPKEFVIHNENGFLVEQDVEKLKQNVEYLLNNHVNDRKIKRNARKTAEQYSVENIMMKIDQLLGA